MTKYRITVVIERDSIQDAINNLLYPVGVPAGGISEVWAEEETE